MKRETHYEAYEQTNLGKHLSKCYEFGKRDIKISCEKTFGGK